MRSWRNFKIQMSNLGRRCTTINYSENKCKKYIPSEIYWVFLKTQIPALEFDFAIINIYQSAITNPIWLHQKLNHVSPKKLFNIGLLMFPLLTVLKLLLTSTTLTILPHALTISKKKFPTSSTELTRAI